MKYLTSAPTNQDLGKAIRRLRRARNLSIEALAHDADLNAAYLSGIERGVRNPTWNKLRGLAQALETSVSEIARLAEVESQSPRGRDLLADIPR